MADYQLTATAYVLRVVDQTYIPDHPDNLDRQLYEQWLADGGVADPYVAPEPAPPEPTPEQLLLYDHENRIRVQEGAPPLNLGEFVTMISGG